MAQGSETHGFVHELVMLSASVLIVATGLAAIVTDRLLRRGLLGPPDRLFRGEALLVVPLVSLSLGSAAIHFTVIPEHFHEWWAFGLFFVVAAWFQAWWAVLFALRPSRVVAAVGAAVNGAIVLVWAASRTVGLPFGPHPGSVEPVGIADIVATAFEVLILAGGALVALGPGLIAPMKIRFAPALMAGTVWVVSVAMATTLGVASLATAASHHGTTVLEQGGSQRGTDASGQEPGSHDHSPASPAPAAGSTMPPTTKPAVVQGGTRKPAPKPSPTPTPAHSHSHP